MREHNFKNTAIASVISIISFSLFSHASFAQNAIAPDNTLPANTLVNFNSTNKTYTITGGTQVGGNQFHSFQDFSVPTSNTAHFDTAPTTVNAIGRVTGSNISNIDGILRTNGTTNLYLVNPNGIVFGANAKLDIAGSFSASTANSIKFSDGSEFSATNPQAPSLLNVNVPLGLQYGNSNTGATISNRGNLSAGRDLTLNADKLDLQGTLQAGRDLTLQAQDLVKIRDSSTSPFVAVAGRDLLVQGNQSVDIFALNNRQSGLFSGGNMLLRSQNPVIGDAHFYAGNNLRIEKLNGSLGNLISPDDPVILANGDVFLGDYTGASLHILAGGSITLGNVTIDSTGAVATTINPNNTTLFNATNTYADLATYGGALGAPSITIDGSQQATLDVRAGVDWSQLGGLPTNQVLGTFLAPNTDPNYATPSNANITINGNIRVSQPNGLVLLTNQFVPNSLTGTILARDIDTSTSLAGVNGGDIRVDGRGDIAIDNAALRSYVSVFANSGNGGAISLSTSNGNISLTNSSIDTYASVSSNTGNGGAISLSTLNGDIALTNSSLSSYSFSVFGNSPRDGGAIALKASNGNISLTNSNLRSYSQSIFENAGNGGTISVTASNGNISFSNSNPSSYSLSRLGNAGNGGDVSFSTSNGNISFIDSLTLTQSLAELGSGNAGNAGAISFSVANGNVTLDNSISVAIAQSNSGNAGNGGAISFTNSNGSISLTGSSAIADGKDGGAISFTNSNGNILLSGLVLRSNSTSINGGDGGAISISNNNGDITGSLISSALSIAGNGGAISFSNTNGNISFTRSIFSSNSQSNTSDTGNGGMISFSNANGNISLDASPLYSYSQADSGNAGNGGAISFSTSSGNISLESSSPSSYSSSNSGNAGNAGKISYATSNGNISLNNSFSSAYSQSSFGNAGIGGVISFYTPNGNISLTNSASFAYSNTNAGNTGNGGAISFFTANGNISLIRSASYSFTNSTNGNVGNAGEIFLSASNGSIITTGARRYLLATAISKLGESGSGGDIKLVAKDQISNFEILTQSSTGQAGAVKIDGSGDLAITNVQISTSQNVSFDAPFTGPITFEVGESGRSGDVVIANTLGSLTFDQTTINTATQSNDPAGNISITSPTLITFQNNSNVTATTNAQGKAGDITINAPIVKINDNSKVLAETNGTGTGGNITINAPTSVDLTRVLDAFPVLSVQTNNAGKAGSIVINTPTLTLTDRARITATASATATNPDGGGSITLNASQMNLFGTVGVFAETQGISPAGTLRLNPYNNLGYLNIALAPNSQISASTSSIGNGGDLFVTAPQSIAIAGQGKLAVETTGLMDNAGKAGNITFTSKQLTLSDGVLVSASTTGRGKAGDVFVRADDFTISNGAQIQTATSSIGDSGTIDVRVVNQFNLSGSKTGLFANTLANSTGRGGDIFIDPESVTLRDGAQIAVGSLGAGTGGNITLISNFLTLLNGSSITAETASANGGNITLNIPSVLLLRYGSQISTTAGTSLAGGNGGNINISAGFIVALPKENSDIFANAFTGNGGNINLTTNGIFGLEFRPILTSLSDITASSQFGVNGTVNINTPGVDPSKGLTNLPVDIGDASKLVTQKCLADRQDSAFVITGRGGIPASPADVISGNNLQENLGTSSNQLGNQLASQSSKLISQSPNQQANPDRIVEAQGWIISDRGEISLIAEVPAIPVTVWSSQPKCVLLSSK
ncbi:filamentous hemagglutinin N-terminal domain-containing protein [Pseudanabaena galeata UHCC 0370]|uniref:Filamentous hemagglutinin N-terminal domain-containing protein n=1 Tax=Pseudanabaena galeata UHCC 0370 TaxID=3110310 RepID=A0ABU5TFJ1_9CYAN|nr:filamentous hemagglutinin N-terminal domain-containing protein [Pseudanabaena galeata]MEA5477020.1 filamentous hemagglutinin N-terminal domain-containing protein [Pseudanabaena galeata UHCC 0370]